MAQTPRDAQYPQYKGVSNQDLKSKLAANERKMAAQEPAINAARAKLKLAEQTRITKVKELRSQRGYTYSEMKAVSKGLRENPNDPQLLAEKARLQKLRQEHVKRLEPYNKAEEKAIQEVEKASEGYGDMFEENANIDHAIRLQTDPNAEWADNDDLWENRASETNYDETPKSEANSVGNDSEEPTNNQKVEDIGESVDVSESARDSKDETTGTGGVKESAEGQGSGKVVDEESAEGSEKLDGNEKTEEDLAQDDTVEKGESDTDGLDVYDEDYSEPEEIGEGNKQTDSNTNADDEDLGEDEDEDSLVGDDPVADIDVNLDFNIKTADYLKPNILNSFASYTYHLELFILSVEDYNNLVDDPQWKIEEQSERLLIKSGGGNYDKRNKFFQLDYYMDNLEIQGVVAPRGENLGGTNTEISFTITEPYGMTLLNSFVMAAKSLGSFNYTDQPYLLKISYKGYDENNNVIADMDNMAMTRYIPLRLVEFQFSANQNGTEYRVQASPYHSIGLQNTKATIPTDIKIEATTVSDFFTKDVTTVRNEVKQVKTAVNPRFRSAQGKNPHMITKRTEIITENVQGGLAGFLNDLEHDFVKDGAKSVADEYKFEIDKDIGESRILLQNLVELRKIKNDKDPRKIALGQFYNNFQFNEEKQSFTIRAGTNLPNVIHSILRTTEYMINQVNVENLRASKKDALKYSEGQDKPILFYRIVPRIRLKNEWDIKRNCYAKEITYIIKKYEMKGKDYENLGQAQITNFVKEYKYIYTGENTEILNFDIQFNTAYYQKNMYGIVEKGKGSGTSKASTADYSDFASGNLATTNPNGTTNVTPFIKEVTVATGGNSDINTPVVDAKTLIVNNFMNDVFNTGADLVELNLEIIGDPAYIATHDLRHAVLASQGMPAMDPETRSLNPDREWHLTVEFRNPVDINEKTGLYEGFGFNDEGVAIVTAPTMSGIYRAVEVTSKFNNGMFTQNLKCIRERLQTASLADDKEKDPSKNVAANNSAKGEIKKQKGDADKTTVGKGSASVDISNPNEMAAAEKLLGDKAKSFTEKMGVDASALANGDIDTIGDVDEDLSSGWQPPGGFSGVPDAISGSGNDASDVKLKGLAGVDQETAEFEAEFDAMNQPKPVKAPPKNVTRDPVRGSITGFNPTVQYKGQFSSIAQAETFSKLRFGSQQEAEQWLKDNK